MSNLEYAGQSLAVGGEVEILLSDVGRVGAKPMYDKDMTQPSRLRIREATYTSPKPNLTPITEAALTHQPIHFRFFFEAISKLQFAYLFMEI